jgi:hypothetical protein
MSYEGYEVIYCICGYRKATREASMFSKLAPDPCPICGSTEEAWDSVDETNGCQCEYIEQEWNYE